MQIAVAHPSPPADNGKAVGQATEKGSGFEAIFGDRMANPPDTSGRGEPAPVLQAADPNHQPHANPDYSTAETPPESVATSDAEIAAAAGGFAASSEKAENAPPERVDRVPPGLAKLVADPVPAYEKSPAPQIIARLATGERPPAPFSTSARQSASGEPVPEAESSSPELTAEPTAISEQPDGAGVSTAPQGETEAQGVEKPPDALAMKVASAGLGGIGETDQPVVAVVPETVESPEVVPEPSAATATGDEVVEAAQAAPVVGDVAPGQADGSAPDETTRPADGWGYWLRRASAMATTESPRDERAGQRAMEVLADSPASKSATLQETPQQQASARFNREVAGLGSATLDGNNPVADPGAKPAQPSIQPVVPEPAQTENPDALPIASKEAGEIARPEQGVSQRLQLTPAASRTGEAINILISRGGERMVVRLDPPQLGRVEVVVERAGGQVSALVRVETPEAQQAITAELGTLKESLEQRGVSLAQIEVDLKAEDEPRPGRRGPDEGGGRNGFEGEEEETDAQAAVGWRPWGFEVLA